jgi:SAM-dependent methyltransferase
MADSTPWSERFYYALKPFLVPDLRNSQYDYADVLLRQSASAHAWLDIGCGHNVVPGWVDHPARGLKPTAGVDLDFEALRRNTHVTWPVMASGEVLPFRSATFDLVTANMVVEHVAAPEAFFREVSRVLRPGGRFVVHTPNVHGYTTVLTQLIPAGVRARVASTLQGRDVADVYPTHYRANAVDIMRSLAADTGFEVIDLACVLSSPQLLKIPPLLVPEMLLLRALSAGSLARWRPCLLAILENRP